MIESALGQIIGSILAGGASAVRPSKKPDDTPKPETMPKKEDKPQPKSEDRPLTKQEKADLEYLLVAGGLSTKEAKQALTGDLIPRKMLKHMDRDVLKQIADITGKHSYEDFIYDGDKLGKGYTSIPLTKANKPKNETMPVPEKKKGSDTTTTKGEEAKDKKTVTKGEDAKSKDTVMEIPEADLERLIEMAYSDWSEKNPKLMEVARQIAMKNKMHVKDVLAQGKKVYDERYQKKLDDEMKQHDAGRIDYEKKLKNPKLKEDTEKAAEKYKAETPDYKYDDIKRNKEAKGEKYTGERHSGKPSEEALRKADDFVTKNAGRDYEARLDRAQNKTSIYRPGK